MQESIGAVCNIADLVEGALQGFAVTVFAFGQTGSVGFAHHAVIASAVSLYRDHRQAVGCIAACQLS